MCVPIRYCQFTPLFRKLCELLVILKLCYILCNKITKLQKFQNAVNILKIILKSIKYAKTCKNNISGRMLRFKPQLKAHLLNIELVAQIVTWDIILIEKTTEKYNRKS